MSDRYTLNQQLAIIMIASVLLVGFLGVVNVGVVKDFPAAPILGAAISLLTAQQVVKQTRNHRRDRNDPNDDE